MKVDLGYNSYPRKHYHQRYILFCTHTHTILLLIEEKNYCLHELDKKISISTESMDVHVLLKLVQCPAL